MKLTTRKDAELKQKILNSAGPQRTGGVLPFHRFCGEVFGVRLTPGQMVISKVCIDGYSLDQLNKEELMLAMEMFRLTASSRISRKCRNTICLRFGRGSGKSTWAALLASYLAMTADVSKCGKGDTPTVAIFAPDKDTAAEVCLNMVYSYFNETPSMSKYIVAKDGQSMMLRRPDGKHVSVKAMAPSKGGKNIRGRSIIALIMDEAEFFNSDPDGAYVINDRDVFKAVQPRMVKDGRVVFISTPWPSENLMSEIITKNLGQPTTALCAIAPTSLMRTDDPDLLDRIEVQRQLDPENAAREFDCDTSQISSGTFFDSVVLASSVKEDIPVLDIRTYPLAAACDFGFKRDSSALAIVQWDGAKYNLVELVERVPKDGKPLVPSDVVKDFAATCLKYGIKSVITDQYYREAIKEHLSSHGLSIIDAPEGMKGKMEVYIRTKAVLDEGMCTLPDNPRFLRQAREIISKPSAGGLLSIKSPRRSGQGHGDMVSAWTLAVHYLAYSSVRNKKETLKDMRKQSYSAYIEKANLLNIERFESSDVAEEEKEIRRGNKHWRYN